VSPNAENKKAAYGLLATSTALIAMDFSIASVESLKIPGTGVSIPPSYLWWLWAFLLIPFVRETRAAKLKLRKRVKDSFHAQLMSYFSRRAPMHPEIDGLSRLELDRLIIKDRFCGLVRECNYECISTLGPGLEETRGPVRCGPLTVAGLYLAAICRALMPLEILERFTLPSALALVAVVGKLVVWYRGITTVDR
jgi:hypothetical protein